MVSVRDGMETARTWVVERHEGVPGYRGAFVAGSVARLADDAVVPAGSDVDVMVVAEEGGYVGKVHIGGIVVEGTVLDAATALDAEAVLRDYHLAPGIVSARIIDDLDGEIARMQAAVRERYADPLTIRWRLDDVESRARATLASAMAEGRTEADRITAWQFGVGQIAHMILVAALENPTVRKRYIAAAGVLSRHDEDVAYERLLRLARFNRLRPPAVEALARDLDDLLQLAGPVADASGSSGQRHWRFASDIGTAMRPVVMDGIRAMIAEGWHREAMFWIVATWCRCAQLVEREREIDRGTTPATTGPGLPEYPALGIARLREALHVATEDDLREAVMEAGEAIGEFRVMANTIAGRIASPDDRSA